MASPTPKPQKRLREFLNEQQEPFILEIYLLERHCSKGCGLNAHSAKCSVFNRKRRKAMLQFLKILLQSLYRNLGFCKEGIVVTKDYGQRNSHVVSVPEATRSSSVFNSCSDVDEEGNSMWSHEDYNLFSSDTWRNSSVCSMGLQRQRDRGIQGSLDSLGKIPLCRVPHDALWSLIGQSVKKKCIMDSRHLLLRPNVSQSAVHKINKLLHISEGNISIAIPDEGGCYKQFICGANLSNLLTSDDLNSRIEWRNIEPQVKDIGVEITDAILECIINNEIVLEMIETSTNRLYKICS